MSLDKTIVYFKQLPEGVEAQVLYPDEPTIMVGGLYADHVDAIVNFGPLFNDAQDYTIASESQLMTEMTDRVSQFDFVKSIFK